MVTREEVVQRLEYVAQEIVELKAALEEGWAKLPVKDPTQAFLEKCGGWEDTRSPDDIIADMYATRTLSHSGAALFGEEGS